LAAYYVLLGAAVWLLITLFPALPGLLDHFRDISVLGIDAARRGGDLEQVVGPSAQTLSQG